MQSYDEYLSPSQKQKSIFYLAKVGEKNAVQKIIEKGECDINEKDFKGYSPLMYASYNGHIEMTRYLIENGADVNSSDLSGNTVLMGASFKGHFEIVQILIRNGSDLKARNQQGQNASDFAHLLGKTKVVELLEGKKYSCPLTILKTFSSWAKFLKLKSSNRREQKSDFNSSNSM